MRLIDVDALDKTVQRLNEMGRGITRNEYKRIDGILFEMPTVDAVPVVRCKDCLYRVGSACDYSAVYVRPNGYCQWGERKEDGIT